MTGRLQWGHGDGAVEEDGRSQKLLKVTPASMGPRRWSRGREYLSAILRPILDQLQWGHGDGAVEEFRRSAVLSGSITLQWGHGDGAVEEIRIRIRIRIHSFNGATAMEPWKSSASGTFLGLAASMGPRRWSRGREPALRTVWSKGLRTGFARGSTRGGVKPIASSGDEVVKSKGNGAWAQREAPARCFRANILIAKELWRECGLIHISAPHRSQVKG